jgi:hypothetical protein
VNWELSRHAETVLQERKIAIEWVRFTLNYPERVEQMTDGTWHYLSRIAENENRVLRVILNRDTNPVRVITVFFDRRMRGQLP